MLPGRLSRHFQLIGEEVGGNSPQPQKSSNPQNPKILKHLLQAHANKVVGAFKTEIPLEIMQEKLNPPINLSSQNLPILSTPLFFHVTWSSEIFCSIANHAFHISLQGQLQKKKNPVAQTGWVMSDCWPNYIKKPTDFPMQLLQLCLGPCALHHSAPIFCWHQL